MDNEFAQDVDSEQSLVGVPPTRTSTQTQIILSEQEALEELSSLLGQQIHFTELAERLSTFILNNKPFRMSVLFSCFLIARLVTHFIYIHRRTVSYCRSILTEELTGPLLGDCERSYKSYSRIEVRDWKYHSFIIPLLSNQYLA
jgi:hypothetical protein